MTKSVSLWHIYSTEPVLLLWYPIKTEPRPKLRLETPCPPPISSSSASPAKVLLTNGGEAELFVSQRPLLLKPIQHSAQQETILFEKQLQILQKARFFPDEESSLLYFHPRKPWKRRHFRPHNSSLLRKCPSPHGQCLHHHRRRFNRPFPGLWSLTSLSRVLVKFQSFCCFTSLSL